MRKTANRYSRRAEIKTAKVGTCFLRLTLDSRHKNSRGLSSVSISVYIKGNSTTFYFPLPYKMTEEEFDAVARSTGKGRIAHDTQSPYRTKIELIKQFDAVVSAVLAYSEHNSITLSGIKSILRSSDGEISFLSFWEDIANEKTPGTSESYLCARKSFIKYVGYIPGCRITSDEIREWEKGMAEDGLSQTTIGIYFRAFRSVWNSAKVKGLVTQVDYPFGKTSTKVKIPTGAMRKKDYLSVEQMTELMNVFLNRRYPSSIGSPQEIELIHFSLGLFLAQYLCNGCNLADLARIRYDEYYFSSGCTSLHFVRHKIKDRAENEVIIPITEPLRQLLEQIAGTVEKDGLVFPQISQSDTSDEIRLRKRVSQENSNVKDRLERLLISLQWTVFPSGTWARHSFATNLAHAGVPREYISEAMGHSVSHASVTNLYIDQYPHPTQMAYNNKLLICDAKTADTVTISRDEYERLLQVLKKGD